MSQKDLVAPELVLTDNLRRKAAAFLTFKSTVAIEMLKWFLCYLQDPTVIPLLMSQLSHSQRTQEYVTQIFSHCCKVFVDIFTRRDAAYASSLATCR